MKFWDEERVIENNAKLLLVCLCGLVVGLLL